MLSNLSQRQLCLEFLETRVNPTRLWFAANALPIPIGTATTTVITLQVPDALVVGDIDLWVNVTHERMDEISLRLRSPSGTIIQLATKQGDASKGYQNTIFDDQAANTLATFSESEGQRYQPEQSLGIFQQLSAQGEWQLLLDDANLQANVGSVNSFKLGFTTMPDDHGDSLSTATPLVSTNVSTWSESGSIENTGDRDWFVWTAPANGSIQLSVNAANGSPIDTYLSLFDSQGVLIDTNDDSGSGTNSALATFVNVGVDYKIEVRGYSTSMGSYTVTLATIDDDHGSTPATATPLTFSGSDTWSSVGSIQYSNDEDWFRWTAPADATFIQVTMDAAGGVLRPMVALLDSGGNDIPGGYSDSLGDSAVFTVSINPDAVYYIHAQSYDGSLGPYTINVMLKTIDDDHGSTPSTATPLTLSGSDTWSSAGSIQYSNDEDWFRWTAPADATFIQVTMDAAGGLLRPNVQLLDSGGNNYQFYADANARSDLSGSSAVFTVSINSGAVYYIRAKNNLNNSFGSYSISIKRLDDDHGSTPGTAMPLSFSDSSIWSGSGSIELSTDEDYFRWIAPADATAIRVTIDAAGGGLRPGVTLLDSGEKFGGAYGYSDSSGGLAVFTCSIIPGAIYYIDVINWGGNSPGIYSVTILLITINDDYGSTPAKAAPLTLSGTGTWSSAGNIELSNDEDWFCWTAPSNATAIQVTMDGAGGVLRSNVTLLDSGGNDIRGAYVSPESPGGSAVFTISIIPGAIHYIRAKSAGGHSVGSYTIKLILINDDHGSTPATATPLIFIGSGVWSSAGSIECSNDDDWFIWMAPIDAMAVQVNMDAAGGLLQPYVKLLDSGGDDIRGEYIYSESPGGSTVITVSINSGGVYYIRATNASIDSLGSYNISLILINDDYGSTPATATPLAISGSYTWSSTGSIEYSNDEDWFRWVAPKNARAIQVTMDAAGGVLQPYVELLDSIGNNYQSYAIAHSDLSGELVVFTVSIISDFVYLIKSQNWNHSLGSYTVTLRMVEDDYGSTQATANPLVISGSGTWSSTGSIEYSNDSDWFRWTAPADTIAIQVTMDATVGMLQPSVALLDSKGNVVGLNRYSYEAGGSAVITQSIVPGALYYIQSQNHNDSLGSYTITLLTIKDDYGSSPVSSILMTGLAQWSVTGEINFSLDHDWFKWVVPLGLNRILVTFVNFGLPAQRMSLAIRNANQVELTGGSSLGDNRSFEM